MHGGYEGDRGKADVWCEGGLGQQRNDRGGCVSMHERSERVESPGAYVLNEFHAAIFAWHCVHLDHSPLLWWLSPGEGWDAVT